MFGLKKILSHGAANKRALLLWVVTLFCASAEAKKLPPVPGTVLHNPANGFTQSAIQDDAYTSYSGAWYNSFRNMSVKNVIRIKINRKNNKLITGKGRITVFLETNFEVYTEGTSGLTPASRLDTVILNYDTSLNAKEYDEAVVVIDKAVKSSITISSVVYDQGGVKYAAGHPDLEIQNTIEIERISTITVPPIVSYWFTTSLPNAAGVPQFLHMNWTAFSGAEEYELEYLFVNDPELPTGAPVSPSAPSWSAYPYNFRHNSTRVTVTTGSEFKIPNLFPRGFLLFRVRPVTRDLNHPDEPVYGNWSLPEYGLYNFTSGAGPAVPTVNPNSSLNWTSGMVFAEESKVGASITYFDGTLRAREGVAYNNSTNTFTVSQTVLDYLGREALTTLPSIALDNHGFAFRAGFNKNINNQPYSYLDFDLNQTDPAKNQDELIVKPMSQNSGANQYFSPNLLSSGQYATLSGSMKRLHTFIPQAEGYAFAQVEFTRDPSGRTWRQGGVGKTHQLKTYDHTGAWLDGKQTLTFDGTPLQEELYGLFGNEVGAYQKYKKVMTQDPNGQLSVALIDPYGRTIATALAGDPANTPNLDPLASSGHSLEYLSELKPTWEDKFSGERILNQDIIVPNTDTWRLYYYYPKTRFSLCDSNLCMECAYDVTISITNPIDYDREMMPGGVPLTLHLGQPLADTTYCSEYQMFEHMPSPIEVILNAGSYTLSKTFRINREKQKSLKEQWLAGSGSGCVKSFSGFLNEEQDKIGNSCEVDCEDCQVGQTALILRIDSMRAWYLANEVDTLADNEYIATKIELKELQAFCKDACDQKTPCESLYDAILADMQPGGQYAEYETMNTETGEITAGIAAGKLSVFFQTTGQWWDGLAGGTIAAKWKHPKNTGSPSGSAEYENYLNPDGTLAMIEVISINGVESPAYSSSVIIGGKKYVYPKNLANLADFIAYYQKNTHWAASLAYLHPEYCYYTACKQVEPVFDYDAILLGTASAKDAVESGFYNPMGLNGASGELGTHAGSNIQYAGLEKPADIRRDVIHQTGAGNHRNPFTNQVIKIPGTNTNWSLPAGLDTLKFIDTLQLIKVSLEGCSTQFTGTIWEYYENFRSQKGLSQFDTCVEDAFWPVLRGLYLQKRNEWIRRWMDDQCTSSNSAVIYTPRWKNMTLSNLAGKMPESPWFDPSIWSSGINYCDPAAIAGKVEQQVGSYCDNQCQANAELWMDKLQGCFDNISWLNNPADPNYIGSAANKAARLDDIKQAMVAMCKGGCDLSHPYGSLDINPEFYDDMVGGGPKYPYRSISQLLSRLLDPDPTNDDTTEWYTAGLCDDVVLDFPGYYSHDYLAYNGPGMDTCACKADKNVRPGITERCPPVGADSLKLNDCGCNKEIHIRDAVMEVKAMDDDKRCQNCITCKELDEPVAEFLRRYDVATEPDSVLMQKMLETWLNRKLGFNHTYTTYWTFALSCVDTAEQYTRPWYDVWKRVGLDRLVAGTESPFRYRSQLFEPEQVAPSLPWQPLHPARPAESWLAADGQHAAAPAVAAPLQTQGVAEVECHCRKILAAAKIAGSNPADYPSGELAYTAMYGSTPGLFTPSMPFDSLKSKCCQLFNAGNTPAEPCPSSYKIGQPFSAAARAEIANQLAIPDPRTSHLSDLSCTPETEQPCYRDLDTCGCNKLQTEFMDYEAWKNAGFSPPKPPIPAGVSFEVYLKYTTGVTTQNAKKLQTLCEELFYKGVARDKNNAPVRGYDPNLPSGWWSKTAQSNLKQKVQDFKISDTLEIPASWSCDPDCTPPPPPCNKTLSPCLMNSSLKLALPGMLDELTGGVTRRSLLGMGSFGYDEMLAELLSWTDQYHQYLAGNTNPPGGVDLERVLFLRDLFTRLNAYYLENTCPGDRPASVDLEFLLKLMLGCGNGGHNFNFNPPCITSPDCQAFGARVKALMATVTWPGYSDPYYTSDAKYAIDFANWYREYLVRKAAGTATPAENDWAAALENDLNTDFNTCYPDKTFGLAWFMSRLSLCMPLPKGTSPACDTCYTANQQWLDAMQVFLSDVTKKDVPNALINYSYYLKPSPGFNNAYYITSFYNSVLYQGGSDQENLTWNLNENYQGGNLMPGLRTLIKDNNGFKLDISLDWPSSEARWNFAEIQKFINIRPLKVKNCNSPKYFFIDVVYKVPKDYQYPGNPWNYSLNYPQPFPMYCYDTITLIGKIWESSNGLGVGKPAPCLGCSKLCNVPYAVVNVPVPDPCEEEKQTAFYNAMQRYNAHIKKMGDWFDSVYREKCFGAEDSLMLRQRLQQYHYTLYYYDQAGQLIKTVPPAGVDIDNQALTAAQRQNLLNDRVATATIHARDRGQVRARMYHGLITNYRYYTGGQLAWQHTPDGGASRFWYDDLGRVALSQSSRQAATGRYSFTRYDELGRPYLAGELEPGSQTYTITDVHLDFEQTSATNTYILDDSTKITHGSRANGIETYDLYKKRLRVPGGSSAWLSSMLEAKFNSLPLAASKSYTLTFNSQLYGGLSSFNYTVSDNTGTLSSGVINTNGNQTISFSTGSGSTGKVTVRLYVSPSSTAESFAIEDFIVTHTATGIQAPSPRNAATDGWIAAYTDAGAKTEVVQTWYNEVPAAVASQLTTVLSSGQGNHLRNRVAFTSREMTYDGDDATYQHGSAYSYDIHGNVSRLIQSIPSLKHMGVNLYTLDYQYDLISGKVNQVVYQKDRPDQWMHRYGYDADNRLERTYTSRDGYIWEQDARYFYYLHGPLARTEIGQLKVQGVDMAYNLNGWIKGVNSPYMTPDEDMGLDGHVPQAGAPTNENQYVGRDAFAFHLGYYNGDYKGLSNQTFEPQRAGSDLHTRYRELFNGNITYMATLLPAISGANSWAGNGAVNSRKLSPSMLGNVYHYDQLNRITKHYAFENYNAPTTPGGLGIWLSGGGSGDGKYHETFAFDAVGNITSLGRNAGTPPAGGAGAGQVGSGPTMDNMTYHYDSRTITISLQQSAGSFSIPVLKSNKLYHVNDLIAATGYDGDIDDQGTFSSAVPTINSINNYGYDSLGNLIRDNAEEIAEIKWNVSGKITAVLRTSTSKKADLEYGYDFAGSRLFKVVIPKVQTGPNTGKRRSQERWDTTWYIKDATGNAMSTYKMTHVRNHADTLKKRFVTEEYYIYGSNRHGTMRGDTFISQAMFEWRKTNYGADSMFTSVLPDSRYLVPGGGYHAMRGVFNYQQGRYQFARGYKQYELSNHLGNVLTTVQDRKWGQNDSAGTPFHSRYYLAYVATVTDYYAFGSAVKERTASFTQKYRFGFNNQEQEIELGEYYSFEYRVHDARLGRFLSVDPLAAEYPWNSTYAFATNNPIGFFELYGLKPGDPQQKVIAGGPTQFLEQQGLTATTKEGWLTLLDNLAAANPDKFSDYNFQASSDQRWAYWDKFQSDKSRWDKGKLFNVPKTQEEVGPAMERIAEFETLMTSSVFPSVTKKKFISDLRARVATGGEQVTQSTNTCGLAALVKIFSDIDPLGYVNFAIDLYQTGRAIKNNYEITAADSRDLIKWASGLESGYSNGKAGGRIEGADLVVIGSLRYVENSPNRFDIKNDGGFDGMTWPSEITDIAQKLLNLKIVQTYSMPAAGTLQLSKWSEESAKKEVHVIMLWNRGMVFNPTYHYQVFNSGKINSNNFEYSYWDYGMTKTNVKTRAYDFTKQMKMIWIFSK